MLLKKFYTVKRKTESSFHSDGMINNIPPRLSPVTNTSLFTLLLQPGFSCLMLPACLCKSSSSLSVPTYRCCRLPDLLSQLYFSLSFLSPFSLFPSLIPSLPLSPPPPRRRTWSGSPVWEPCLWWAARETTSRTRCALCRRNWTALSLWWLSCLASWLSSRNR